VVGRSTEECDEGRYSCRLAAGCNVSREMPLFLVAYHASGKRKQMSKMRWYARGFGVLQIRANMAKGHEGPLRWRGWRDVMKTAYQAFL
jgi:hypothetical protein